MPRGDIPEGGYSRGEDNSERENIPELIYSVLPGLCFAFSNDPIFDVTWVKFRGVVGLDPDCDRASFPFGGAVFIVVVVLAEFKVFLGVTVAALLGVTVAELLGVAVPELRGVTVPEFGACRGATVADFGACRGVTVAELLGVTVAVPGACRGVTVAELGTSRGVTVGFGSWGFFLISGEIKSGDSEFFCFKASSNPES